MTPHFLDLSDVLDIHDSRIRFYGGSPGLRDLGLMQSALAQPALCFGGKFLHKDLFEMAAAYLFHVARNHAFVDGNKRASLLPTLSALFSVGSLLTAAVGGGVDFFTRGVLKTFAVI